MKTFRIIQLGVYLNLFCSASYSHAQGDYKNNSLPEGDRIEMEFLFLQSSADSVYVYWNETTQAKQKNDELLNLLMQTPNHRRAPYLLYYAAWNTMWMIQPKSQAHYLDSLINRYIPYFNEKDWFYHNMISVTYMILAQLYINTGDYNKAVNLYADINYHVVSALTLSARSRDDYLSSLKRAYQFYTNKGYLLYRTTHYMDPVDKRNDLGQLIEKDWLKADSIHGIIVDNNFQSVACEPTIYTNLSLLYGHYLRNDLKSSLYYEKANERLKICEETLPAGLLDEYKAYLQLSQIWNNFVAGSYEEVIHYTQDLLPVAQELFISNRGLYASLYSDLLYCTTTSYYNLTEYDSATKYARLMLADTVYFKDYSNLASISSLLADISLSKGEAPSVTRDFLQMSKSFIEMAQHEASQRKFIKEGEERELRQVAKRLTRVSDQVSEYEDRMNRMRLYLYISILALSVLGLVFFIQRLRKNRVLMKMHAD